MKILWFSFSLSGGRGEGGERRAETKVVDDEIEVTRPRLALALAWRAWRNLDIWDKRRYSIDSTQNSQAKVVKMGAAVPFLRFGTFIWCTGISGLPRRMVPM